MISISYMLPFCQVCGVLEGIIPTDHPTPELRNLASIVDSEIIKE